MRGQPVPKRGVAFAALAVICSAAAATCGAQGLALGWAAPTPDSARVTTADAATLVERIKGVESPTFRAYFYAHASAFLLGRAGEDAVLKRAAELFNIQQPDVCLFHGQPVVEHAVVL
jgi:hypothetical protein